MLVAAAGAGGYLAGSRGGEQTVRQIPRDWSVCANRVEGYVVAYPSNWHAADLSEERTCTFFDPRPLEIPPNSDAYGFALEVAVARDDFDSVVRSLTDTRFFEVVKRDDVEVSGRPAVRVEARATGEGLYERGLATYAYAVDRVERTPIVLQTFRSPGSRWEQRKAVLDEAARTLVLFTPPEPDEGEAGTQFGLPRRVARKHAVLVAAARSGDYERLAALADPEMFQYTYGGGAGGPAAYWRQLEEADRPAPAWAADPDPADALAAILEMPYTVVDVPGSLADADRIYVWPFAYDKELGALTPAQREVLAPIATEREIRQMERFGSYIDWRTGITPDGRWIFFIAGD